MKIMELFAEKLDLPAEALAGTIRVMVTGQNRVLIENHRGILAYTEDLLEVSGGKQRLRVRGENLLLRAMDQNELLLTGKVYGLDLE